MRFYALSGQALAAPSLLDLHVPLPARGGCWRQRCLHISRQRFVFMRRQLFVNMGGPLAFGADAISLG